MVEWLARWNFDLKVACFEAGLCRLVVFLDNKTLHHVASLHAGA